MGIADALAEQLVTTADPANRPSFGRHALRKQIEASVTHEAQSLYRLFRTRKDYGIQTTIRRLMQSNQFNIRFPGQRFEVREIGNSRHIDDPNDEPIGLA